MKTDSVDLACYTQDAASAGDLPPAPEDGLSVGKKE